MGEQVTFTPLRVWVGVGGVWTLLVLSFLVWLHLFDPIHTQDWVKVHRTRVEAAPSGPRWIVVLGRSTLMNATELEPDMDRTLARVGLEGYRVFKVGHVGGVYSDFVDLESQLLGLNPVLVVAEVGLMLTDRPLAARVYFLKRWFKHRVGNNQAIWRPQGETFLLGVDRYLPCPLDKDRGPAKLKHYVDRHNGHLDDRLARYFGGPSSRLALEFVATLQERGIPLALTYVPRAEGVIGARDELLTEDLRKLQDQFSTPVWSPEWKPQIEDLCDSMHYTTRGRAWYTTWLAEHMAQELGVGGKP